MVGLRPPTGRLQLADVASITAHLCELLNPSASDRELLADDRRGHLMTDDCRTDSVDVVLLQPYLRCSLIGQTTPTKSLAYTTR
jgi:hypothetical protein